MSQVQQVPQEPLALQDDPQEGEMEGSRDPGAHRDHRGIQAHLEFLGKMDRLEAKAKLVSQERVGFQDFQGFRESLDLKETRVILVLDYQALQGHLDLQVDLASLPCSWRGQDLKTLTAMRRERLLGGLQDLPGLLAPQGSRGPQEPHLEPHLGRSFLDHLGLLGKMERMVNLDSLESMEKMGIQGLPGKRETRESLV